MSAAGWVATIRRQDSGGLVWLGKGHGTPEEAMRQGDEAKARLERVMGRGVLGEVIVVHKVDDPGPPREQVVTRRPAAEMTAGEIVAELRRLTDTMCRQFDRLVREIQQRKG